MSSNSSSISIRSRNSRELHRIRRCHCRLTVCDACVASQFKLLIPSHLPPSVHTSSSTITTAFFRLSLLVFYLLVVFLHFRNRFLLLFHLGSLLFLLLIL